MKRLCSFLLFVLLAANSHADNLSLNGNWKFIQSDISDAQKVDYNDILWDAIYVPKSWGKQGYEKKGYAWYRKKITLPENFDRVGLGINVGLIADVHRVYFNGILIGELGRFPPDFEVYYSREKIYQIPDRLVNHSGDNVIAVQVWSKDYQTAITGMYDGNLEIGNYGKLVEHQFKRELIKIIFPLMVIIIGLFYIPNFFRRRQNTEYLLFAFMCLSIGTRALMRSEFRFLFSDNFLLMKEIEVLGLYLAPCFIIEFVYKILQQRPPWIIRLCQIVSIILLSYIVVSWDMAASFQVLPIFYVLVIIIMIMGIPQLIKNANRGNDEARTMLYGVMVLSAFTIADMMVERGWLRINIQDVVIRDLTTIGFCAMIFAMALTVSNNYFKLQKSLTEAEHKTKLREIGNVAVHLGDKIKNPLAIIKMSSDMGTELLNIDGFEKNIPKVKQLFQKISRNVLDAAGELTTLDRFKEYAAKDAVHLSYKSPTEMEAKESKDA